MESEPLDVPYIVRLFPVQTTSLDPSGYRDWVKARLSHAKWFW